MPDFRLPAAALAAALLSACASAPQSVEPQSAAAKTNCDDLRAALTQANEAEHEALDRQKNAWKVVVPVAVAARYASAKSDAEAAGRQRSALQAQAAEQSCPLNPTREG